MTALLINLLTFLAVFLAIFAVNYVLVDLRASDRKRVRKRMDEQVRQQQREKARTSLHEFSKIAAEARAGKQESTELRERLTLWIDQSGLSISLRYLVTLSSVCGGVLGLAGGAIFLNVAIGVLAALAGASIPMLYVSFKRTKRLEKMRSQLSDAFDLMSRVLRAGQSISQAMHAVAEEFQEPVAVEYLCCYEQMNLGMAPEDALRDLGRRTGLLEIKIFVLAVVVHRQTGGNLAELLDKIALVVRERFRIRGMINALTAQGRFSAAILLGLPPFMFVLLMLLHYEYEVILLDYPLMIMTALGLMALGALWIRKIVNFDF
jgi:tight adherence protein B